MKVLVTGGRAWVDLAPVQRELEALPKGTILIHGACRGADNTADWMAGDVEIPDSDSLHGDLMGPGYTYNAKQQMVLETKEQMRKKGVRSPDEAEALAQTFAYPVNINERTDISKMRKGRPTDWRTA